MLEELVSRTFAVRNAAHLAHWRAKGPGSFARHMALGEFYDELIEQLDDIVEAYQGAFGKLVGPVNLAAQDTHGDILEMLSSECNWATENREAIADGSPAIENMLDELSGLYLKTIYKLRFLS